MSRNGRQLAMFDAQLSAEKGKVSTGLKPGYKQTEVGVIPEDWTVKSIGGEIDLLMGFPFPSSQYASGGIRLLRGSNIKRGVTDWGEEITQYWRAITPDLVPYSLREGDLVIAMDGSLVGRSYARISKEDLPALLLQRVAMIRSAKIELGYLKEFVGSEYFIKYCDSLKTVTAIPHISPSDVRNFTIPLPPSIEEQKAIATALSNVDALISSLDKLIAKKRDIKQGAMQQLLTGEKRLPGFSKEWETRSLSEVIELISGQHVLAKDYSTKEDGIPYLTGPADFSSGTTVVTKWTTDPKVIAEFGDILLTVKGSGAGGVVSLNLPNAVISRQLMAIRTHSVVPGFLFYALQRFSKALSLMSVGNLIPGLGRKDVLSCVISLPSPPEQQAIATILSDMDAEIAALEQKRDKTRVLKQGMMQELLTGRTRLI